MNYYYLDGIEKKGPFSLEEMLEKNLSVDILVFRDDKTSWSPFFTFDELTLKDISNNESVGVSRNNLSEIPYENKTLGNKTKIKLPNYTVPLIFIVTALLLAALVAFIQRKNDYKKISDEINLVFKNKTSISDYYINNNIDGNLLDVVYHKSLDPIFGVSEYVTLGDKDIATKPYKEYSGTRYQEQLKQWELFKKTKQFFIKKKYVDPFIVHNLWRSSDVFTIVTFIGCDLAYTVPEKEHIPGINNSLVSIPGFDVSNYRPSITDCYSEAAEYLTKEGKNSTYVPGSYSKILDFQLGGYKSDFYEIKQIGDKYYRWSDTIRVVYTDGKKGYVIDDEQITPSTSRNDGYIFTSKWIVWYKRFFNRYSLEPIKWSFLIRFSIYAFIGVILALTIYFIIKNRSRFEIEF